MIQTGQNSNLSPELVLVTEIISDQLKHRRFCCWFCLSLHEQKGVWVLGSVLSLVGSGPANANANANQVVVSVTSWGRS